MTVLCFLGSTQLIRPEMATLMTFSIHENQPFPPSLDSGGELRFGTKSDLLTCLEKIAPFPTKIQMWMHWYLMGAVVAQMLQSINCKTLNSMQ